MTITAFFVYGTLKRGFLREDCWPREPKAVSIATINGDLYDLGDYPALTKGQSLVKGEIWEFDEDDMAATITALDRVEWFQQDDCDLYVREIVLAKKEDGQVRRGFGYFYVNQDELQIANRIVPDANGVCEWAR